MLKNTKKKVEKLWKIKNYSPLRDIVMFLHKQLNGSEKNFGYR